MNVLDDLRTLAESIFADRLDPTDAPLHRSFDQSLWPTLCDAGLTTLTLPEDAGGAGAGLAEAAVVLDRAAAHAAPVPLAETEWLGAWLLHRAGLPVPGEPLTAATGLTVGGGRVRGTLSRVPWARVAHTVAVLTDERVVALPSAAVDIVANANLAGEPRDTVIVDVSLDDVSSGVAAPGMAEELRLRGALARAVALAGANARAVDLAIEHAVTREQFGRALSKFQAVQQQIAEVGAEAATARAAADIAVHAATEHGFDDPRTAFAVAVAKSRAGAAAGIIARASHQLHGAIGFTLEHQLRLTSTRMWSWREEYGDEGHWNTWLAARALSSGADGLWPLLTALP